MTLLDLGARVVGDVVDSGSMTGNGNYQWTDAERPCIGAARLIERELGDVSANLMFRLAVMHGKLDRSAIDRTIPLLDTVETFVNGEDG